MKLYPRETCEDIIERLIEDLRELNEEAITEIEALGFVTHENLKRNPGFDGL
jgi:hypothetical protein